MSRNRQRGQGVGRRAFVKAALAGATGVGLGAHVLDVHAQRGTAATPAAPQPAPPQAPLPPLGNGEPPAVTFQAYPGGTGAYLEKLAKERGRAAFDRTAFQVEPWKGAVPGAEEDIAFLPVHRLSALIRARHLTSVDLTNIYLTRLKRFDPVLLCAVTIIEGQAREAAQEADREIKAGRYRGPLHGIPWGVKDLFSTRGVRTTWGAADFENRVIDEDAEIVVRMREAGAVLIAKLATGKFASGDNWFRGQTKNPWNPTQGSSGSSAGPSSATVAGCVGFGIGTETLGSIVSPATRCGLSALRPTFGRVSRYGAMTLSWTQDKVGPICRTIEDVALVFSVIHGVDEKDPSTVAAPFAFDRRSVLSKLRIGYDEQASKDVVEKLRALGADPKPVGTRPSTRGVNGLGVESAAAFDSYVASHPQAPESAMAPPAAAGSDPAAAGRGGGRGGRFTSGRSVTALDFLQGQRRRLILMRDMDKVMSQFDMYVSGSGDVTLTNQTGHPAVIVPTGWSTGDHPQPTVTTIIGGLFEDDKILSVAHAYQQATDWHLRHPKLA